MSPTTLIEKDIRELQRLAQEAPAAPARTKRKPLSRAARLQLIDLLSRWSGSGLALIAGASIYLAISVGRSYPARAAAWALIMLATLWVCRRLRSQFRSGDTTSARPFRWRASYTSCLSVLGVAFASAPILLTPSTAPYTLFLQVCALAIIGAYGAAFLHCAHPTSAMAFAAPATILTCLAAVRAGDPALLIAFGGVAALGLFAVYTLSSAIAGRARRRFPRTTFLRREIDAPAAAKVSKARMSPTASAV